jgi:hypothetical protein
MGSAPKGIFTATCNLSWSKVVTVTKSTQQMSLGFKSMKAGSNRLWQAECRWYDLDADTPQPSNTKTKEVLETPENVDMYK